MVNFYESDLIRCNAFTFMFSIVMEYADNGDLF